MVCITEDAQRVLVTKPKGKKSLRIPCCKCKNISMNFYVSYTVHCNIIVLFYLFSFIFFPMPPHVLSDFVGSNPTAGMNVCCECCQVEVSATSWSLVQRSPIDCGALLSVI